MKSKILLSVLITALCTSALMYMILRPHTPIISQDTSSTPENSAVVLPVVAYGRPGLLNNTPQGQQEKKVLEHKLIGPMVDFYKEHGGGLVSLYVTVPEHVGEPYDVVGIFCGGSYVCGGTEGFLFGSRGKEYASWDPPCHDMDGKCTFSDSFKQKYPEIKE